jgi:hypothetical protein
MTDTPFRDTLKTLLTAGTLNGLTFPGTTLPRFFVRPELVKNKGREAVHNVGKNRPARERAGDAIKELYPNGVP